MSTIKSPLNLVLLAIGAFLSLMTAMIFMLVVNSETPSIDLGTATIMACIYLAINFLLWLSIFYPPTGEYVEKILRVELSIIVLCLLALMVYTAKHFKDVGI